VAQNLIEKISQRYAVGLTAKMEVKSGDFISIKPAYVLTHDNTAAVMMKFKAIGATKMANPRQPMFALDHDIQNKSEANVKKYKNIEAFSKEVGVDFYPAGRGIGHQIIVEEGYAFPGEMTVASDSHANMYGGIGCLGTPLVRTDAAAIWATGRTWWQVPPVAKCVLTGKLQEGVTGKDVIVTLCGVFNKDEVLNHAVEFCGDGVESLPMNERLTIANMTTEWGALVGLFPIDEESLRWLDERADYIEKRGLEGVPSDKDFGSIHPRINRERIETLRKAIPKADEGAFYAKEMTLDLSSVRPYISGPNHVKVMCSVAEMEKRELKIQKAYLLSCVNGRLSDFTEAAKVIKGKKVADGVDLYISAASSEVQYESEKLGDWQILVEAGAKVLPPGCGPCIGLGVGLLEAGEVGISATNRNFKGRMGSKDAEAYLSSPAVVVASAVAGKICGPVQYEHVEPKASIKINEQPELEAGLVELIEGFPESIEGELLFCHQDNMNTDGIYPGKYTYIDDYPPEKMAEAVMENYDEHFGEIAKEGDILVGGFNFGTGSSREQAATSLKYRGLQLILGGSFSQTYKRNALNNGFMVLEVPELVKDLKAFLGDKTPTVRTGWVGNIDFKKATMTANRKTYKLRPLGKAAQELIVEGGLESWVKARM
jgi:homoaconitate hydratase